MPEQPNGSPRLAVEILATADALRNVSRQIDRLERAGHPAVASSAEAAVIASNGPTLVEALETLAERLAIVQ